MAKDKILQIRVTAEQLESYKNLAISRGLTLTALILRLLDDASPNGPVITKTVITDKPPVNPVITPIAMPIIQRDSVKPVITDDPRRWGPGQGLKKR